MIILGINAYHGDAAACLVRDGELIAAGEEERFRRIKHWAGFPSEAIAWCLADAGITLADVDHVAVNRDPRANFGRKLRYVLKTRPSLRLLFDRVRNAREWASIEDRLGAAFVGETFRGELHHVEHHLAHLGSAFFASPFENAAVASVDGFGDFASAAWGMGSDTRIAIDDQVYFPHSLGVFYQALTQFIGFPNYGDEYKMMGLAPYGEPKYLDAMRRIVALRKDGGFRLDLRYFRHGTERVEYEWEDASPSVGRLYTDELAELLGPARGADEPLEQKHRDIARSVQAMYEEAFFHLLNKLHERHPTDALALAGGCAMNSVANGKVTRQTPFRKLYIQSAAGDAGGAIGAALVTWHRLSNAPRGSGMKHAYWGPHFEFSDFRALLANRRADLEAADCVIEETRDETTLCQRTAEAIAQGKVIGWFQGRMEWGPRALGNRSILCDPRNPNMKDVLNSKIKRRESFRPFAPSILREAVPDWFETDDDVPFMMKVFQVREAQRARIPAVTHVDGSGRLQTVHRDTNPRYYQLIEAFAALTGVPILLNTSFNENEPVVCQPQEALDCFLRTDMDVLVLGDIFIARQRHDAAAARTP